MDHNNILGVVLAGGKSLRFGKDKSQVKLGDRILIDYILNEIIDQFNEILVVANKQITFMNSKKIYKVTCPTELTKKHLEKYNIFQNSKLITLYDPIFSAADTIRRHNNIKNDNKFLLSAGRLTRQKNFSFLIEAFSKIKLSDTILYIAGEGEEKNKLINLINKKKLNDKVKLIGYRSDLFELMNKCECFILTSRWEDPGFVLVEAAISRATIISSDCENGPREIIQNEKNGFLFKNNDLNDFVKSFNRYKTTSPKDIYNKKINGLKNAKKFSILSHYKKLNQILN